MSLWIGYELKLAIAIHTLEGKVRNNRLTLTMSFKEIEMHLSVFVFSWVFSGSC